MVPYPFDWVPDDSEVLKYIPAKHRLVVCWSLLTGDWLVVNDSAHIIERYTTTPICKSEVGGLVVGWIVLSGELVDPTRFKNNPLNRSMPNCWVFVF